jgi:hypothetical protein
MEDFEMKPINKALNKKTPNLNSEFFMSNSIIICVKKIVVLTMNLSYWEQKTWLNNVDYVVVGSGIVGLSTCTSPQNKTPQQPK